MHFLWSTAVLVLDILALVQVVQSKSKDTNKILWVLIIIFLPFVGPILWWAVGQKQR